MVLESRRIILVAEKEEEDGENDRGDLVDGTVRYSSSGRIEDHTKGEGPCLGESEIK
jgi:hypothetical protein